MDKEIIRRYLKGDCTPEERAEIKSLMLSGEAEALFDEVLNEGWDEVPLETGDAQQLAGWKAKFQKKIASQEAIKQPRKFQYWRHIAAALVFFTLGSGAYLWQRSKDRSANSLLAMQETVSPGGKLIKIKLSDSSTIILNAASHLKYPSTFNGKRREVYLDGEAFFDITHDQAHPFIVHTSRINVSVLGTSFNVRSYRTDKKTTVSVATGKIGVMSNQKGSKPLMLLPGEQLTYNVSNGESIFAKVNAAEVGAWQSGMLICRNESLENICLQLERWYDVKITFRRASLGELRFNLKQKNDRLENVMKTLKYAGGIHYAIAGKTVNIW